MHLFHSKLSTIIFIDVIRVKISTSIINRGSAATSAAIHWHEARGTLVQIAPVLVRQKTVRMKLDNTIDY